MGDQGESQDVASVDDDGAEVDAQPAIEAQPAVEGGPRRRDHTVLFQLLSAAVALVAITAVIAVLLTKSILQGADPETESRLRGTSFDSFTRANGSVLETTATGRPWQIVSGDWTVEDNRAAVKAAEGAGGGSALALFDTGASDQYVQATFFDPEAGTGLVTRFQGPNNFIGVTFAPVSGTVQLGVTVDGRRAEPSQIGSALAEGEVTLGVRTEGENVIVYVNGDETGRQVVSELREGSRSGVLIRAGDAPKSFIDDVVAVPLSTEPLGALGGGAATSAEDDAGPAEGDTGPAEGDTGPAEGDTGPVETAPAASPTTAAGAPTPGALEPAGPEAP